MRARLQGGRRAGDGDERPGVPQRGPRARPRRDDPRSTSPKRRRSSSLGGSDGATRSVSRTLPICVEMRVVDESGSASRRRTPWSRRRYRSGGRARARVEAPRPAEERERRLALAVDHLGLEPDPIANGTEELLTVGRVSDRGRRPDPDPSACRARARLANRAIASLARSIAAGSSEPVSSTPCPSRVITMSRASSVGPHAAAAGPGRAAGSSSCPGRSPRPGSPARPRARVPPVRPSIAPRRRPRRRGGTRSARAGT